MKELEFFEWAKKEGLLEELNAPKKEPEKKELDLRKIRRRVEEHLRSHPYSILPIANILGVRRD